MITIDDYKSFEFKEIPLSTKELFRFDDYNEWVNCATRLYSSCGITEEDRKAITITLDAKGRLCRRGSDFMRARDEKTFPVLVYILNVTL